MATSLAGAPFIGVPRYGADETRILQSSSSGMCAVHPCVTCTPWHSSHVSAGRILQRRVGACTLGRARGRTRTPSRAARWRACEEVSSGSCGFCIFETSEAAGAHFGPEPYGPTKRRLQTRARFPTTRRARQKRPSRILRARRRGSIELIFIPIGESSRVVRGKSE